MLTKYFTEDEFLICCDILNGSKSKKTAIKRFLLDNVKHWVWKTSESGIDVATWERKIFDMTPTMNDELYTKVKEFWDEADEVDSTCSFDCDARLKEMGLIWE